LTAELVKNYYTANVRKEWRRLVKDAYHRLEFETTLHYLERYLPGHGLVLDAGGGPGRYTLELARRGYDVVLQDLTPANLDFARRQMKRAGLRRRVKDVVEGSISDLSRFADGTFDAVLCAGGPLSHVVDPSERERALAELVRVARPAAPLFISVIGRLSVLVTDLLIAQHALELPHFKPLRDTGDFPGETGFTACHFFLPEEFQEELSRQPVDLVHMVGLEGISSHHRRALNRVAKNPERWQVWLETHYATCTHPAVVGVSEHILAVCRKP
jgi:SAM-dependent methyltransferase